jgi:hypothetical protein
MLQAAGDALDASVVHSLLCTDAKIAGDAAQHSRSVVRGGWWWCHAQAELDMQAVSSGDVSAMDSE